MASSWGASWLGSWGTSWARSTPPPPPPPPAPTSNPGGGALYPQSAKYWREIHAEVRDRREAQEITEIIMALCATGVLD